MKNWDRPQNHDTGQQYLFKTPTDEVLAKLKFSHDDARRWHGRGWLSFEVREKQEHDPPLEYEFRFVSGIARAGLDDAQVNELLSNLVKPYRYDPDSIAYSFEHGWVTPPEEKVPFDVVEENIDDWLESLADEGEIQRLARLREFISELLDTVGPDGERKVNE